jgi:predicted AlkP superfamily phosphohydrolase/phosphomutase
MAAAAIAVGCADTGGGPKPTHPTGLVVLGVDGMDPVLTRGMLERGELPNLASLIARGGWSELDTTSPPQSPVAWSTFITGLDAPGHGIFDFVHRDPTHLTPYLSTSRVTPPDRTIEVGSWALPLGSVNVELLRGGVAFWQVLERHGVPATVVKVPANFPPPASVQAESMSGMGTPDLLGTYGTFQLVGDDAARNATVRRGIVHAIDFAGSHTARARLTGPPDPLSASGAAMTLPLEIIRDPELDAAVIRVGGRDVILTAGEWSEWLPVAFDPGVLAGAVPGMLRLYLARVHPSFELYVSPINIDPMDPALPIASPARYATALADDIGRFYTQGMPEDTKALATGALAPDEFLAIVDRVMAETWAMLDRELARFRGGFLFVYLSSIDQTSHVFFRSLDPSAPAADRAYADAIPALYRRVDRWIGEVVARVGPETRIVVMSDHGFAPYHTKVHLNAFLAERGYLAVAPPDRRMPGPLGHIDWERTQAYAFGLNQVFVNLRGREARGAVAPAERDAVLARLERDLLALRDPDSGQTAVTRLDRPPPGRYPGRAPDLVVGYRRGFRSSDESAIGEVGARVFEPNTDRWSGDHCMDPAAVPGVIAANVPLAGGPRPTLADLAPTILAVFGVPRPPELAGRPLLMEPAP